MQIKTGSLLTVKGGEADFRMIADKVKGDVVIGQLMDARGTCTVPLTDVKKVGSVVKTRPVFEPLPEPKVVASKAVKPKAAGTKHKTGTTLDKAVVIAAANPEASRQELIEMLVKQLGMTPAGASTYASKARQLSKR